MIESKADFYKKAQESLTYHGYQYFDGDQDIQTKGRQHASKPDYIAIKGKDLVIGEIKSPAEPPTSASWRQIQKNDSDAFKAVRLDVSCREKHGEISREVGGHEIVITGQIPDYYHKIGITYDLPVTDCKDYQIVFGYTAPVTEVVHIEYALNYCRKKILEKIDGGNGAVTFIFTELEPVISCVTEQSFSDSSSAYYCILRNYKGYFKKKFLGNTHLYFFPVTGDQYIYLGMLGQLEGEHNRYLLDLISEFDADLLGSLIQGEIEEFGERFEVMESVACKVDPLSGGWRIKIDKKGQYIRSDIKIRLEAGSRDRGKPQYILKGELSFNQ